MKPTATQISPDKEIKVNTNPAPSSLLPGCSATITVVSDRIKSPVTFPAECSTDYDACEMLHKSHASQRGVCGKCLSTQHSPSDYSSIQDTALRLSDHDKEGKKCLEEFVASFQPLPSKEFAISCDQIPSRCSIVSFEDSHTSEALQISRSSSVTHNSPSSSQTAHNEMTLHGPRGFPAPCHPSPITRSSQVEQGHFPRISTFAITQVSASSPLPHPPLKADIAESIPVLETKTSPEVFHIHMKATYNHSARSEDSTFVGRRDVRDTESLEEKRIISAKGTVRGFRNRVRAGIATYITSGMSKCGYCHLITQCITEHLSFSSFCLDLYVQQTCYRCCHQKNYHLLEKGRIIIYTTSMTVIRETYDQCRAARNILQTHMVRYEERDLFMNREHQQELRERLNITVNVKLPQIFVDGFYIGGAEDLEKLNESEELRKIFCSFPKIQMRTMCDRCGGFRFVPCRICHGSKKSIHRNHFTQEFCALRCMHCNENGLQHCDQCLDQQE